MESTKTANCTQLKGDFYCLTTNCTKICQSCLFCSRSTASRFGKHLPVFVEDVIKTAQSDDDELKEYSFHTLETFLQKCQSDILPFVPKVGIILFDDEC